VVQKNKKKEKRHTQEHRAGAKAQGDRTEKGKVGAKKEEKKTPRT